MEEDEEEEDVSFGLSSLLFIIPWAYSQFTLSKTFSVWTTVLLFLPITSFFCNAYPDHKKYTFLDHTVIIVLSMIYLLYNKNIFLPLLIYVLFIIEMCFVKDLSTTTMISFVALNLFAFTNFTRPELIIGLIVFTLSVFCKLYRNCKHKTYPFYTTIWHIGCVVLLILASRSINRLGTKAIKNFA